MKIALIGPPNCGKSTLFNIVAGYKSVSSNFPGTTVKYTESKIRLNGNVSTIVDFPGCYSLSSFNEIDTDVREYLFFSPIDIIVNVLDASSLGRGLTLTLELMDMNVPMVLCLNMMDEAEKKGISIETGALSDLLGIPVVTTIASKDIGIKELFAAVKTTVNSKGQPCKKQQLCQKDVEKIISELAALTGGKLTAGSNITPRYVAVKLLEEDSQFAEQTELPISKSLIKKTKLLQKELAENRGKPADSVIAMERYALAMQIFRNVSTIEHPQKDWRESLDDILMHKVWGYVIMALALLGIFYSVYGIGSFIETPLIELFGTMEAYIVKISGITEGFMFHLIKGLLYGVSGGMAIVLPYLVPFLVILTIVEDIGYLPRVAYLMDSFMHRIGLHGTSIVPIVLGYGCSVPAVMATRILPSRRDKIIAAIIATLIPCSARSVVIYGLVAFYLGAPAALAIYILNIIIVAISGKVLSSIMPEVSPGIIMDVPRYQLPSLSAVSRKVWFRLREFIVIAWPLLIAGSIILAIAEYFHWDAIFNTALSPLTGLIGLPAVVGTVLIFGILRKELSLIMLVQAIGTANVLSVLTAQQIMVFTIFVTFYIPCAATIAVLLKEFQVRWTTLIVGITLFLAIVLALLTRFAFILL